MTDAEGSGALNADGRPLHRGGIATAVPSLGFVGMEFQRSFSFKTCAAWVAMPGTSSPG
ncbi:hypothetical protein ACFWU3_30730 [Streptomyces sp. NPDC058685]|uniref:hypothetical protein n=1 Tax=Streptomyces sp. NPDC058685 TaxID=3346598 RepID=UPI00364CB547